MTTTTSMTIRDIELYASAAIRLGNVGPAIDVVRQEIRNEFRNLPSEVDNDKLEKLVILHKALLTYYTGEAKKPALEGIEMFIVDGVKYEPLWKILSLQEAIEISNL